MHSEAHEIDLAQYDEDFEATEAEKRDYEDVPDGTYQAKVERVEIGAAKSSGVPMLKWQLRIIAPRCQNRMLFRNNMIGKEYLKWLKTDLATAGLQLNKLSDLPNRLNELLDVVLEVKKVTKGENSNVYFNRQVQVEYQAPADDEPRAGDVPF